MLKYGSKHLIAAAVCGLTLTGGAQAMTERLVEIIGDGGIRIAGTLTLPDGFRDGLPESGVPALLLIQGSGPTDRDGNQPPRYVTNLARQMAAVLAKQGVASLRFDKRGLHANAASMPRDPEALADFARWEKQVGDAAQAFRFLAQQPGIDPQRTGVFGHSEGGLIALELAAGAQTVSPAALVLAATPGRDLASVLNDQLEKLMIRQGAPEAVRRDILARNTAIAAHIRTKGEMPADIPPGLQGLYPNYLRYFLQSTFALDPLALAREVQGPVLVLNGSSDPQVLADRDASLLASTLMGRGMPTSLYVVGNVSHTLKETPSMEANAHEGEIHPDVLQALASWLESIGWAAE